MNAIATVNAALVPTSMTEAMKLAEMMASAKLVPKDLQKSPADCLMVIQQAVRWQMDPFAVAQECSVIQGKLMHSGKLVAAVVNSRGNLAERLSFSYSGDNGNRTITVRGRLQGESEPRTVEVRLGDAKTNNRVWQSQPDQQLMYHGCRVWARRHTPELMLGVWSPEEFDEAASNAAAAAPEPIVIEHEPPKRKSSAAAKRDEDWPRFEKALNDCQSAREVERLQEEYRRDVYPAWNKDWREQADEAFMKALVLFTQADLPQTLADSVEETAPPTHSKAEYVRNCHGIIDHFDKEDALLAWWNAKEQKDARRANELTKEEIQALMARVMSRRAELVNPLAGG